MKDSRLSRRLLITLVSMLLCVPPAVAVAGDDASTTTAGTGSRVTLPSAPDPVVIDALAPNVVARYEFEPGDWAGRRGAARSPNKNQIPFDPDTGTYQYIWLTDQAWSGSCRQLVVTSADGGVYGARFRFH